MTESIEFIFRENKWLNHILRSQDWPFFCFKSYIISKCSIPKSCFNQPTAEPEQPRTSELIRINCLKPNSTRTRTSVKVQ